MRGYLADCDSYELEPARLLQWANASLPVSVTAEDFSNTNEEAVSAMLVEKVRNAYDVRVGTLPAEVLD